MTGRTPLAAFALAGLLAVLAAQIGGGRADEPTLDWNRVQQLRQRETRGEKLSAEDQAYLNHAKEIFRDKLAHRPTSQPADHPKAPPRDSTGLVPLTDLAANDKYNGEDGGLYGGGQNQPPRAWAQAAATQIAQIVPRDADGKPDEAGKIVLLSMGMSNTTQEFARFKQLAEHDPAKSPQVVIVDGAQGGQDAADWNDKAKYEKIWGEVGGRLKDAGVTARQVQAVWLKQAIKGPARLGDFPRHAQYLKDQIVGNLNLARDHFPNLRVAYLSSRIYAGYADTTLNPEPYAYESAFAVRWAVLDQIKGDKQSNWDPAKGEVKSPLLLWGPYLWADGVKARKGDHLVWNRADFGPDGTHPSAETGRGKVAELLLQFFKTDPQAKPWFAAAP